jgi:hypothetical protein
MNPRFKRARRIVVMTLGLFLTAGPAFAGIADSPLPVLEAGKRTYHVYSVPGVIDHVGGLVTLFSCTSTDTATMQVGVETFNFFGGGPTNDAVTTSLSVAPGATVTFGTGTAVGFNISSDLAAGSFSKGSARILATSKKLACTAFIADALNSPPTSMTYLTIIKGIKQKAAN